MASLRLDAAARKPEPTQSKLEAFNALAHTVVTAVELGRHARAVELAGQAAEQVR